MLTSLELRWFSPGELPSDVASWFSSAELGGQLQAPEAREDVYLYVPECEYMGIKLRQGRLEIKWRQVDLGILRLERAEGKLEKWSKWLCEDPTTESFQPELVLKQKSWVRIGKVRSQRLYDDFALELTQLTIENNLWWSLALETLGADARARDRLQNIFELVGKTYVGLALPAQNSYAYPKWIEIAIAPHANI
jgi:hypothetical protein